MMDNFYGWLVKRFPRQLVMRCAFYAITLVTNKCDRFREMSVIDLLKRLDVENNE